MDIRVGARCSEVRLLKIRTGDSKAQAIVKFCYKIECWRATEEQSFGYIDKSRLLGLP